MIAILETTLSTTYQNRTNTESPRTMGATINNENVNNRATALERTSVKATGDLNAFYWYQILALDSVVKTQTCLVPWRLPNLCSAKFRSMLPKLIIFEVLYELNVAGLFRSLFLI